jgi:exosortase
VDPALSGTSALQSSVVLQNQQNHDPSGTDPNRSIDRWGTFTALFAVWWIAIDHLRVEWSINEQYSYGWMVPWLALYLFAIRWKSRPSPERPRFQVAVLALLNLLALAWLPAHLLQVSSPDWRLIGWALAGLAVVFTLGALYLVGGGAWLRYFWFPVAFTLVAVPWPVPLEQSIVQSLMRTVAATSVEALRWCGFPAVQHGNVIQMGSSGTVGIEEACSGVRSMQTMVMTALFLGELWHRRFWRRVALLVGGLAVALTLNVARAFTMSWLTANLGMRVSRDWHDCVGIGFLALTLITFALIAFVLRERPGRETGVSPTPRLRATFLFSWHWSAALLGWLLVVWIGTESWYRSGEKLRGTRREIVIQWPEKEVGFQEISIPARTGIILRHDEGRNASWRADDGEPWSMVYLRWKVGSAAVQLARAHTPDVCLPAAGGRLEVDRGLVMIPAGEAILPAHAFTFTAAGRPIHVFYMRFGDDAGSNWLPSDIDELNVANRIRAALARRRNCGQQVVEVAITSSRSPEEVAESFMNFSRSAFRISNAGGS